MTRPEKQKLETLLSEHVTGTLEAQRGRAKAAFRAHIQHSAPPEPIPLSATPRRLWLWAGLPSALAACLAVAVTLMVVNRPDNRPSTDNPLRIEAKTTPIPQQKDEIVWTRDVDD